MTGKQRSRQLHEQRGRQLQAVKNRTIAPYKITVEDTFQSKTQPNDLRFHNLWYVVDIEKVADNIGSSSEVQNGNRPYTAKYASTTTYSIADLYEFVKRFDKEKSAETGLDANIGTNSETRLF